MYAVVITNALKNWSRALKKKSNSNEYIKERKIQNFDESMYRESGTVRLYFWKSIFNAIDPKISREINSEYSKNILHR
jgi:hypothetical protein